MMPTQFRVQIARLSFLTMSSLVIFSLQASWAQGTGSSPSNPPSNLSIEDRGMLAQADAEGESRAERTQRIAQARVQAAKENSATVLILSGLGLQELPAELWDISTLEILCLDGNNLTALPPSLGQLSNLRMLLLNNNRIQSLPSTVDQLENLQILDLARNELSAVPDNLSHIPNLKHLGPVNK